MQVDELKAAPNDERDAGLSAPELAQRALDRELNGIGAPQVHLPAPVNDLTSMVVKKKKKAPPAPAGSSGAAEKRKAEGDEEEMGKAPTDKKARLEENTPAAAP